MVAVDDRWCRRPVLDGPLINAGPVHLAVATGTTHRQRIDGYSKSGSHTNPLSPHYDSPWAACSGR